MSLNPRRTPRTKALMRLVVALLLAISTSAVISQPGKVRASGVAYNVGDVFAGVGTGLIKHFSPTGVLLDTLNTGSGSSEDTGMCFDAAGNLRSTNFEANDMSLFDNMGNLTQHPWGSGFNFNPESCVHDQAGNIYVGQADGGANILKFDPAGNLLASYAVATGPRGSDWIDLAADQCTMFYASESPNIRRFNVCTNTQLPDFASGLPAPCFALRIRANGEVLVACSSEVVRLSPTGTILQTYTLPGGNNLFALNIDPDGTSFWTANIDQVGQIWRVDIATGAVITTFDANAFVDVAGLAVFGERTVGGGDTTPPSCALTGVIAGPPKQIQITVQDSDGGLKSVVVTESNNASTPVPPFTVGTTSPVLVTATKIDQSQGAQVALQVTDMAGNVTNCDPVFTDIIRDAGHPTITAASGIAQSEHLVHIYNGDPGLTHLTILVNGIRMVERDLVPNEQRTVDIGAALQPGSNNTVTIIARGKQRGEATIVIADS